MIIEGVVQVFIKYAVVLNVIQRGIGDFRRESAVEATDSVPPENKLYILERETWLAQPPSKSVPKLRHPVPYVIISETSTDSCKTQANCTYRVRVTQTYDIEAQNWNDIGCNFMIGGDGYAYEGRGWEAVGEGLNGYEPRSIGISFIGTFKNDEPPSIQLKAAEKLIKLGVEGGRIAPDYKLLALRQIARTSNPGDALYNIIKAWPHWVPGSEATLGTLPTALGPAESETDLGDDIHIFTKKRWGGREIDVSQNGILAHPIPLIIIGHTVCCGYCNTTEDCQAKARDVQDFVVDKGEWLDIQYNFMIGGDGNIYQALGWDIQNPRRNNSLWVSFVGNYVYDHLNQRQEKALQLLLRKGIELGKIDEDYRLIAHCQLMNTLSPGRNVLKAMKRWPNYDNRTYT